MAVTPQQAEALLKQATTLHGQGRVAEAAAIYHRLLAQFPRHADLLNLAGVAAHQQGDDRAALGLLAKAVKLRPDHAEAHNNYGNVLQAAGQLAKARQHFQRALKLQPDYHEAQRNLGNLLRQEGDLEAAAGAYRRALTLEPGNAVTLVYLGGTLSAAGHLDEALDSYREAAAAKPNYARAHGGEGAVLQKLGRNDEAEAATRRSLGLAPEDPQTHFNLGCILTGKGEMQAAGAALRRALELDPAHQKALYQLAMIERALGRDAASREALEGLLTLNPDHASARHMLDALLGRTTPIAPRDHIRQIFDDYAPGFEQHLVGSLGYKAPELLAELAREAAGTEAEMAGRPFRHGLDLGCGTGLVARQMAGLVSAFDGIDLAPKMAAAARGSGLYLRVFEGEILDYFAAPPWPLPAYDLVTSADTFIYIGALESIFTALAGVMAPGGLFVFSVEDLGDGTYGLLPTGRYAQSRSYIAALAAAHGFRIEREEAFPLRQEFGQTIPGLAYGLRAGAGS